MDRELFESIYPKQLTQKQEEVLSLFIAEGLTNNEIAKKLDVHHAAPIHRIKKICEKFEIQLVNNPEYRESLVKIFIKFRPDLVCNKVREKYNLVGHLRYPDGAEPIDSIFYFDRDIKNQCYTEFKQPGALIRIKAPKQMGKTSFLKCIIAEAKRVNFHTVYCDLTLIEVSESTDLSTFLQQFYAYVVGKLGKLPNVKLDAQLNSDLPPMIDCTHRFQSLLKQVSNNLILILDEVDKLFEYPKIYKSFFEMLRNWHDDPATDSEKFEIWGKLRLVMAYSTEDYGRLDIDKSPFNVGAPFDLVDLTSEQIKTLAIRYNLGSDYQRIFPLEKLVGGHPFLIRLGFHNLAQNNLTIEKLIKDAKTDGGIYKPHLLRFLCILQTKVELCKLYREILKQEKLEGLFWV